VPLIIENGISKVVISNIDPNPLVAGKGIEQLRGEGIEVVYNIISDEGLELNKEYFQQFQH